MTAIEEYENQLVESNTLKSDYSAKIIKNYLKKKLVAKMKNEANTLSQKTKYDKLKDYLKSDNRKQTSFNDFNRLLGLKIELMEGFMDLKEQEKIKKI